MRWKWPWHWFCRPADVEAADELVAARGKYRDALAQMRQTTSVIKASTSSASLEEVERRVKIADDMMRDAFRRRIPSGG